VTNAIEVEGLAKHFRIPLDRSSSLKYRITHPRSTSRYRVLEALEDITFDVPAGQFLGIIGHNGSGKSTLLKILSRIYQPDAGRVLIRGEVSPFLELGVGFNPELSVRENIFLNGAILGITRNEVGRRMEEILDFAQAGLPEPFAADQKLKNLSSGMQVRLAFSVAIQADAAVLLMDEVLAVGDATFQQKCFEIFSRYKREGRTVILVTHELGSVNMYCDRALLLEHGRLVADGAATDVTAQYKRRIGHATEAPSDSAIDEVERWGTADVAITAVRLANAEGKAHRTLSSDAGAVIELDYVINNDNATDFLCSLTVSRDDGMVLAQPVTALSQYAQVGARQRGSRGTIRYAIPALGLLGGAYTISAELTERRGTHPYDHLDRVIAFSVVDEKTRPGLLELGGSWSVTTVAAESTGSPAGR
jgi:lipopolysaccharide transport system ATP-binding protein